MTWNLQSATWRGQAPGWWLPQDAALHGAGLDRHLLLNLWIALSLLAMVHLVLLAGLVARRRVSTRSSWAASFEYLPLTLLTLLFAFLTVRSERLWAATRYTGADPGAMQVEATGVQFVWYFRYPGKDAAFGRTRPELIAPAEGSPLGIDPADQKGLDDFVSAELVLPVGREVDVRLHAQDVIHGFAVPEMRIKQNAVPGQEFHIHFTPTRTGTYAILCTQLCGLGHFHMTATMRILTAEAYAAWLTGHEQAATP
jgi:cytochrome c oxidase subunit 2